jgi:hypothetical protein
MNTRVDTDLRRVTRGGRSAVKKLNLKSLEHLMNSLQKLLDFLNQLEQKKIYFTLARCRSEAIMVRVDVPGERWEIEYFADGHVEVEVFRGGGPRSGIEDESALDRLFEEFSD